MTWKLRLQRAAVITTVAAITSMLTLVTWATVAVDTDAVDLGFRVDAGGILFITIILVLTAAAGYFAYRVPDNGVPWLLLGVIVAVGVGQIAFAIHDVSVGPLRMVAGSLSFLGWWPPIVLGVVFLPLLFPTGRPPTHRWRWVAGAGLVALAGSSAWFVVALARDCLTCDRVGIGWLDAIYSISIGLVGVSAVGSVTSMAVRFRRSRGFEREQLKWLLLPLAIALIGFLIIVINDNLVAGVLFVVGALGVPIGIVIGITRHRLYEIDRIVSRVVTYAIVAIVLAGLFAAIAVVPAAVVGAADLPPSLVAISTLAVFALFNPLRRRVQDAVDRRFARTTYEVDEVLSAMRRRFHEVIDPQGLAGTLAALAHQTLSPARAVVWIRGSS